MKKCVSIGIVIAVIGIMFAVVKHVFHEATAKNTEENTEDKAE